MGIKIINSGNNSRHSRAQCTDDVNAKKTSAVRKIFERVTLNWSRITARFEMRVSRWMLLLLLMLRDYQINGAFRGLWFIYSNSSIGLRSCHRCGPFPTRQSMSLRDSDWTSQAGPSVDTQNFHVRIRNVGAVFFQVPVSTATACTPFGALRTFVPPNQSQRQFK